MPYELKLLSQVVNKSKPSFMVSMSNKVQRRHFLYSYLQPESRAHFQDERTTVLWENYFPGAKSIQARFARVKKMYKQRNVAQGLPENFVPKGRKSAADPIHFCKQNFPPVSYSDQYEFKACLEALHVPEVQLEAGESTQATDISGTPAGRNQPDGPGSLSPGSDGWSRW
jgi:hypothetical protein